MALESRTNLILQAVVDRLADIPTLPDYILGDQTEVSIDTSFRIPDKTDYARNQKFVHTDFQVQVVDELFEKISVTDAYKNMGGSGQEIKDVNGYKVDAVVRIIYYHLNQNDNAATTQQDGFRVSDFMVSAILGMDYDLISAKEFDEDGEDDYFVESIDISRRNVLEKQSGRHPNTIPIQHLFHLVYYTGGAFAIPVTEED